MLWKLCICMYFYGRWFFWTIITSLLSPHMKTDRMSLKGRESSLSFLPGDLLHSLFSFPWLDKVWGFVS